ncbi:hypothetical protein GE21DRAFT_3578 [Neurospora crassa]|uniref:Uncharacterized protein n=2 Tax=Neurospora crassa TaxID=5141 RepID=Q1K8W5_NEUCR|nr:hypothetical protein NCU08702 [Neurospora crassa OR74A]EAA34327.1 hypothetical protein NCU08702 [Neurospora crassa OR74A]KHE82922.1 hypothetical protein GE21DRAFT_3578 [Neurospora crassa]CAB99390.1 conserved hypothetical protein [Neurospora crassa]|eukprot:XP_963563.1 hypothetical protein NCU08702 [Neurospora crassa OR74A]
MQQLPCGCCRVGRRNCIEPNCPRESEISQNNLFFCPVARERNLHRTGEPELCPVELPAASYTQIVPTGRCAKHRKEMEDNLQRKKKREQKEKEKRRRELEQEREKEERERRRVSNLGSIREGVVETGNGNERGSGMDANEMLHLNAVLDARERARSTQGVEVERGVEVVRESGLGWVDEGLKNLTVDEEREKGEENEKGEEDEKEKEKKDEKEEKEQVVKWNYKTKEDRENRYKEKSKEERERMERARKRYTGIDALGKVKAATAMLEEMVAKEWEDEDARDDGNEGMTEARRDSEPLRRRRNETNRELSSLMANRSVSGNSMLRPAGDRPTGGEARRVSGPLRRHGNEADSNISSVVTGHSSRSVSGNSVARQAGGARPAGGAYEDVDDEINRRVDEDGGDLYDMD